MKLTKEQVLLIQSSLMAKHAGYKRKIEEYEKHKDIPWAVDKANQWKKEETETIELYHLFDRVLFDQETITR